MGLLFFDRYKDGTQKSMNSALSMDEMQRGIELEKHVSIFEDYLNSGAAGDGTYGYQGDYAGEKRLTAPKAMTGDLSHSAMVARVRARMDQGLAPLLVSMDPKTGVKIFAEEDKDAFQHGYICENCVQYQAVPNAPKCNWMRKPDDGCGFQNY